MSGMSWAHRRIELCRKSQKSSKLSAMTSDFTMSYSKRLNDFCPHLTRGDVTLEEIRDFAYHFAIAEGSAPGSFTFNDAYQTIYDAMTDDEKTALADIIRIAQP